jgi:signal transduction histidine kinase
MSALAQPQPKLDSADTRAKQQLGEAQRMEAIGRLVSGVAHDFNNLLTGIVLCADLLLAGLEKSSPLCRYAQEIRTASAQSAEMIQQLLAVARQPADEPALLSLNDVIAGVQNLLTRLLGENVELRTELADDLRMVRIDPAQVQQIILNLALNARDAMPDGGRITLSTGNCQAGRRKDCPSGFIQLEVRDTGCGMDAKTRSRAFEPFFTTKKTGKGTGLGLATVYGIVKKKRGTIAIESKPGCGTRVIVRLPAANSQPAGPPRARAFETACDRGTTSEQEIQQQKIENQEGRTSL